MRTCRKKTGPRESSLIATATTANSGASSASPRARRRGPASASGPGRPESRGGGSPTSGMPSIVCICAFVPSTSNMRGTMSIWTSMSCIDRMTLERLLVRVGRERDRRPGRRRARRRGSGSRSVDAEETGCSPPFVSERRRRGRRSRRRSGRTRGASRSSRASSRATGPEPTMITFWMYAALAPPTARITARSIGTRTIARSQKTTRRPRSDAAGRSRCVTTRNAHVPSVTTWKTPTTSSTVEWSVRSSSRSYRPWMRASRIQKGSVATKRTISQTGADAISRIGRRARPTATT